MANTSDNYSCHHFWNYNCQHFWNYVPSISKYCSWWNVWMHCCNLKKHQRSRRETPYVTYLSVCSYEREKKHATPSGPQSSRSRGQKALEGFPLASSPQPQSKPWQFSRPPHPSLISPRFSLRYTVIFLYLSFSYLAETVTIMPSPRNHILDSFRLAAALSGNGWSAKSMSLTTSTSLIPKFKIRPRQRPNFDS